MCRNAIFLLCLAAIRPLAAEVLGAQAGLPQASPSPALPLPPPAYRAGFESISERDLRAWLGFLASAELEGRESGTRGYDVAARYIASVLEGLGVVPMGGDGTYFQEFHLVRLERDLENARLELRGGSGEPESFPLRDHVAVRAGGDIDWSGPWVFAGHGDGGPDAHDDFHGLSLEGKVVLVIPRPGSRREEEGARRAGARRVVIVSDERVKSRAGLSSGQRAMEPGAKLPVEDLGMDVVYLSRAATDRVLSRAGTSVERLLAGPARPLPDLLDGVAVRLELKVRETRRATRNVVGLVEGSDPALRGEVVAVGAHLDHVGIQDQKLFPGADDDASGTSAVLGVASALALNPVRPRRSVLLLFFAAEEIGLLGSSYFVDHPPVGLDRFVAEFQLDMVGRNEERTSDDPARAERAEDNVNTIHVVGSTRHALELDPWLSSVNEHVGLVFERDEERVYTRSDHYHFARHGIPVTFFFAGFHPDYHKPTDTIEKINFTKLLNVTRLVYSIAYEVADRERRLPVNKF
ncbi:MAG TPA: M20/M25/M40 family metallo-hydrolase [Planctomycetota bacterium]|nr:M20/M25/M40 family metallo-hydrolase [Planctomycetota bacterium]